MFTAEGLASCAELTTAHASQAASSSASMRALLTWASAIARPSEGAPKILMAIARLTRADWMEGTPFVEIRGDDHETTISVFTTHGMGMRERVLPLTRLRVPVDEFARAVRLAPQLIAPFKYTHKSNALILQPGDAVTEEEARPDEITIDDSSLHEQERATAPPPPHFESDPPPSGEHRERTSQVAIRGSNHPLHTAPTVRRMVAVRPEARRKEE